MPNINRNGDLDREETEILEAYERGELNGAPVSNDMVSGAKETMKKHDKGSESNCINSVTKATLGSKQFDSDP